MTGEPITVTQRNASQPGQSDRVRRVLETFVERGSVPGLVSVVGTHDDAWIDALGVMTRDGAPMCRDTIFRITSMTKPITAVATMLLVEDGSLGLDDAVDEWLPELADRHVLRRIDGPLDDTVPAHRPITVRDLLTFRLGLGIVMAFPEIYPIQLAIRDLDIVGFGPTDPSTPHDPDEWMRRLGTLPLMHQPGERWMYNTGSYVLGVLLARVSGQPLETLFRERIFDPLGMHDTGFHVPPDKLDRLTECYSPNPDRGTLDRYDGRHDSAWSQPPVFPDAGAGLVSTADDYLAFARMLLNMGSHGEERILSPESVETITRDHLTAEQRAGAGPILGENRGWGFGLSVVSASNGGSPSTGRYGWDGGFGTFWMNDSSTGLITILMTQRFLYPDPTGIERDFLEAATSATEGRGRPRT